MTDPTDPPLDDATRAALAALPVDEPPAGFADRVLAARAGVHATPVIAPPRRRRGLAAVAVAMVAAAALTLLVWPRDRASQAGHGARVAEARESIAIAGRGVAVAETGATIAWRVDDDGHAHVDQGGGNVFYRVEPGAAFEINTPAGDVRVTGTCFRVEVTPMKPSRAALAGAALGAALTAALVVTVYEGHVVVASPDGTSQSVAAGEHVALGQPPVRDDVTIAALAPPPPDVTRDELLARDATQRATVQQLGARVAGLERQLAVRAPDATTAGATWPGADHHGERDPDGRPYFDPSPETLLQMAKECAVRQDMPPLNDSTPYVLSAEDGAKMGLEPEELEPINAALRELHARWLDLLRALYIEATGDEAGAEGLSPSSLGQEIQDKAAKGEMQRVTTLLSRERAGLAEAPTDLAGTSPVERYLRASARLGDDFEELLAASLGPARARALREAHDGWDNKWTRSGCADE